MKKIIHRRWLAGALAVALVGATPAGALAAEQTMPAVEAPAVEVPGPRVSRPVPKVSQEEALATLREHFPVPEEQGNFSIQVHLNTEPGQLTWTFHGEIREGNSTMGYQFASVDATTGRILRYSDVYPHQGPVRTGPLPAARPETEAREKAWKLIQQLYPEAAPRLQPTGKPDFLPVPADSPADLYGFTWVEYHGGVPMPGSSVTVGVDKSTLDVLYLQYGVLESITFADSTPKVTPEQAMQAWREAIQPRLRYQPTYETGPTGQGKITGYDLVYQFDGTGLLVDAHSGAFSDARGAVQASRPEAKPVPEAKAPSAALPLGPITEADATRVAAALLQAPADAELMVMPDGGGPDWLSVHLSSPYGSSHVQFDRSTGLIRSAWRSTRSGGRPVAEVTPAVEEQARQAAIAVIQQHFGPVRSQLRLEPTPEGLFSSADTSTRRFMFYRFVNGVQAGYDSVQVNIDLASMTWRDIHSNWTTGMEFPPLTNVITPEKALETFFAKRKAELIYQPVLKFYPVPMLGRRYASPTEAALVYSLSGEGGMVLNAYTGAEAPRTSEAQSSMESALKQIAGHWAEGELRHLLRMKLLLPATLNPDGPLTRTEAVRWLLSSREIGYGVPSELMLPFEDVARDDAAFEPVAAAYMQGWLRPSGDSATFRPDDAATRAEFAVWAMRMLGLGDLARTNLAVQDRYSDLAGLTREQRNAANFLEAMALLSSGEKFRGAEPITQAEAAALVVRMINLRFTR